MSETTPPDNTNRIHEAIFAGRKIEAIKLHREQTGLGLAESKAAVEALEVTLRAASPEKFSQAAASKSGCAAVFIVGAGLVVWRMFA